MPTLRERFRGGTRANGGMIGYPLAQLAGEVAYVAYHFHWSYEQVMSLEHREREMWVNEIAKINHRLNEALEEGREWL